MRVSIQTFLTKLYDQSPSRHLQHGSNEQVMMISSKGVSLYSIHPIIYLRYFSWCCTVGSGLSVVGL